MKNLRKTLTALLAAAMTMALAVMPAMAETLDNDNGYITCSVPSGWEYSEDYSTFSDNQDSKLYRRGNDDEGYGWIKVQTAGKNNPDKFQITPGVEQEVVDYVTEMVASRGGVASNFSTGYETINGIQFLKVSYEELDPDGNTWYEVEYRITGFKFVYESGWPSKPFYQDFYNMLSTVSFTPAPAKTGVTTGPVGDDDTIKIYVNGSRVYPDSDPVIINDRTLVPIRVVAEAMGYNVDWVASERAVDIHNDFASLYLTIGSSSINHYTYGYAGEITSLDTLYADVAPQIINDRTYLPLRAVGEGLGAQVEWDGNSRSVYISDGAVG